MSKTNGHARSASSGPRTQDPGVITRPRQRRETARASAGAKRWMAGSSPAMTSVRMERRLSAAAEDLLRFANARRFATFLADPPWRFTNKTGKVAPEHKRLARYGTMTLPEIMALPVEQLAAPTAHLYLWCPNALLPDGIAVMKAWGFTYKSNIVWHKVRKDGGSDGRGVGFYFRNVTELDPVRRARQERAHACAGAAAGEPAGDAQARAFAQARRAIRDHRGVQPGSVSRAVRARHAQGLGHLGQPGRRRLSADLEDVFTSFGGGQDHRRGIARRRGGVASIRRARGSHARSCASRSSDPRPAVTRRLMDPSCRTDSGRAGPVPR